MKFLITLALATLAAGLTHAEELTFVATGQVTSMSVGGQYLGGRLENPVSLEDEARFYYTFESTTPPSLPAGSSNQRYGNESAGVTAIKRARVEVSGNVWEFIPCGAPGYCSARIELNNDLAVAQGVYQDLYLVNAVDRYQGIDYQILFRLSTTSASAPIPALTSTDLPLVPPKPEDFAERIVYLSSTAPPLTIAVGSVTSLQPVPADSAPPTVSGLFATPNPVAVGFDTVLFATISDADDGGSNVESAEFRVGDGLYGAMRPDDGSFDSVTEVVEVTLPTSTWYAGVYDVCVRGTDKYGHRSEPADDAINACTLVVVYDPSGGFVTGGGWFYSKAGACSYDTVCREAAGKANFGFVSRYKKGAQIPAGDTEFQFSAGGLNFHSQVYDWLVVNGNGSAAQYKGSGTINGNLSPAGEAYKFMLWAIDGRDAAEDSLRIKIWYEDADIDIVVYDNAFEQPIGGGSIVVHST